MFGFDSGKPVFPNKHLNHREQVEPLISLYQDGESSPEEQRIVEFYLERCTECRALYAAFSKIQTDLGEFLSATPVPHIDPGFYRQTSFYQANQRKQAFDGDSKGNILPFVNAASPVISGGNSGTHHRASFAASFGGLAAAIALLLGVGALLFLSINSINNNNPAPTVAQVAYGKVSAAAESPTDTTAPATATPAPTDTTAPANSTKAQVTNTPKNTGDTKNTSGSSTSNNSQGVATTTTVPSAKTTKAAGNATTTVASAVTTAPLNTVSAATVAPQSPDTTTAAATTANTTTVVASTTSATTTIAPTTEGSTVTPAITTSPLASTTPTLSGTSRASTVSGALTVTPTVTPAFTEPATDNTVGPTVTAATSISSTTAAIATGSANNTAVVTSTATANATTAEAQTTATTTPSTAVTAPATVSATTIPSTTANAVVSAPGLIAYVSTKDGEVHLTKSDGTGDYALTAGTSGSIIWTQLVWSPDARWLAAVGKNRNNGVYSIYTLDIQSSHPDTNPVVDGFAPAWSPNSRLLAYLADATIDANGVHIGKSSVFDLKHRVSTALDNSYTGFGPEWFPDGQQLLTGQSNIYKIMLSATARTFDVTLERRVKLAFTNTCLATSLSPDGTRLANLEIATNGNLLLVYYDLTRTGNPRIPLATVTGLNNTIRAGHNCGTLRLNWTPSGHSIYFYAQSGNIYYNVLESVSTGEVNYLNYIYAPNFTQDGAYLVDYDPTTSQVYALPSSVNSRPSNSPIIALAAFAPVWQPV